MALSLSGDDEEYDSETEQVRAFTFSEPVCVLVRVLYERKLFFFVSGAGVFPPLLQISDWFLPALLRNAVEPRWKKKNACVIQSLCCVNSHTGCRDEYMAKRIVL